MGVATLAGKTFRIDPSSISWNFQSKTSETNTVGGKVIQVYGTKVSDMTVSGQFGVGGWREQLQFLEAMKQIADKQIKEGLSKRTGVGPTRFTYSPKGWDFLVYLKAYTSPDGSKAVVHNLNPNPKWTLTLFMVDDNTDLRKVAQDSFIARISKGIGWRQTAFNGPSHDLNQTVVTSRGGGGGNYI